MAVFASISEQCTVGEGAMIIKVSLFHLLPHIFVVPTLHLSSSGFVHQPSGWHLFKTAREAFVALLK